VLFWYLHIISLIIVWIVVIIILACQSNNIYNLQGESFTVHYPRKLWGWRNKTIQYSNIIELVFKEKVRTGEGHGILIKKQNQESILLFYSSFMKNKDQDIFIQEFRNKLGDEKVKDERFGTGKVIQVPK
jgi:hypothetical protein